MSHPAFRHIEPTHCHRQRPGSRGRPASQSLTVLLCSMLLIFGACTTTQTVYPQSQAATQDDLKPGDAVVVSLRDGRELKLSVVEWTGEKLVGRDREDLLHPISRQDIAHLEVTRVSGVKTALLVVTIAGVALAYATASAFEQLWAPPIL